MYSMQKFAGILSILLLITRGVHSQIEQFVEPSSDGDAGFSGSPRHDAEIKLKQYLLKNYARDVAPPQNSSGPTIAEFSISVQSIQGLDAQRQLLISECWLLLNWRDERLSWNKDKFEGIKDIRMDRKFIWIPDVKLSNGIRGFRGGGDTWPVIRSNGGITFIPSLTLKSFCHVDLKYYPYDEHDCKLKFRTLTPNLVITSNSSTPDLMTLQNPAEWSVINSSINSDRRIDESSQNVITKEDLIVTIVLRRRSPFYKATILCSLVAATLLVMTSLWLSPMARQRITINFVSLIIFVATALILIAKLPAVGNSVPIIVAVYGYLIMITIIIIISTILFSSVARRRRHLSVPSRISWITESRLAAILIVSHTKSFETLINSAEDENDSTDEAKSLHADHFYQWISFFQFIDRIVFVIFTLVIVALLITTSS